MAFASKADPPVLQLIDHNVTRLVDTSRDGSDYLIIGPDER